MYLYNDSSPDHCYHVTSKYGTLCKLQNCMSLTKFKALDTIPPHRLCCRLCRNKVQKGVKIEDYTVEIAPKKMSAKKEQRSLRRKLNKLKKRHGKKEGAIFENPERSIHVFANSVEFLSSYEWRELRYKVLKTNNGKCELCGRGKAQGMILHVDHIKPRKHHPELALNITNLQVLCEECNHGKGNWDQTDWRAK